MIQSDELAHEASLFLGACSGIEATQQHAALGDLAVRRVVSALYDGDVDRLERWYRLQRDERPDVMADILHAACHAVALGFERDDPARLGEALWALEIMECEVAQPTERRTCCHNHPLGVSIKFQQSA